MTRCRKRTSTNVPPQPSRPKRTVADALTPLRRTDTVR